MKYKINISIPKPCNQNWESMTITDKTRFCSSCQKNVFDFSKSSDREIVNAYNKDNNLCGRFNESQLNRDLIITKEKKTFWTAIAAAIIAFLGLGSLDVQAQNEVLKIEQTDEKELTTETDAIISNQESEFSGVIIDEKGMAIPGVSIKIKEKKTNTSSDFYGKFKIKANMGDVLVFTSIGLITKEITLVSSSKNKIFVTLKFDELEIFKVGGIMFANDED